jgi:pimeloyl-ACP methyl ester carboxylesterase
MANKHRNTETQGHRERPHQRGLRTAAFLCVLVSLCLCVSAEAQIFPKPRKDTGPKPKNIHGVVLDARSKPLSGARVFLKDMKTNVVRTLETDQNGEYKVFALTPTVDYELHAEFKGKSSEKKFVSSFLNREDNVLNFQLDLAVIDNAVAPATSDAVFKTYDLVELHASFELPPGIPAPIPAVLLLHGYGEDRSAWKDFSKQLLTQGWAVMALDLRGHGQSRLKNQRPIEAAPDWRTNAHEFPQDLDPALDWLKSQPRIDNRKIVVIGSDVGANLALIASGRFREVRTVVAIKPNLTESQYLAGSAQDFQPRSALIVVPDAASGNQISKDVSKPSRVMTIDSLSTTDGTARWLSEARVRDQIFQWLKETF